MLISFLFLQLCTISTLAKEIKQNGWQIRFQKLFGIIVLEMFLIKIENINVTKEKNIEV